MPQGWRVPVSFRDGLSHRLCSEFSIKYMTGMTIIIAVTNLSVMMNDKLNMQGSVALAQRMLVDRGKCVTPDEKAIARLRHF